MKMKKLMSLLLACVMVLAMLAGCSDKPSGEASKAPENPSTESKAPEEGDKTPEGDGKSITMWSMWSSGEPQANVIQEAAAAL